MPELPEVETVRRQMEKEVVGEEIGKIEIRDSMCFDGDSEILVGRKIEKVGRVGKWLLVGLSEGAGMEVHLRMTGRLVVDDKYRSMPHTRVVMELVSGGALYYWDTRKFGYVRAWESEKEMTKVVKAKVGPDPWEISDKVFLGILKKTNRKIKDILLDQKVLAGVGNIYANDALWLAGINPERSASEIGEDEAKLLLQSIREVMGVGLASGGASDNTYRDFYGKSGNYQNKFLVYGRTGAKCVRCGGVIERIVIGGRGTWVCRGCQV